MEKGGIHPGNEILQGLADPFEPQLGERGGDKASLQRGSRLSQSERDRGHWNSSTSVSRLVNVEGRVTVALSEEEYGKAGTLKTDVNSSFRIPRSRNGMQFNYSERRCGSGPPKDRIGNDRRCFFSRLERRLVSVRSSGANKFAVRIPTRPNC